jgi:hypothetical protein
VILRFLFFRVPNPYNLFFSEVYSTVMATNPKVSFGLVVDDLVVEGVIWWLRGG